MDAQPRFTPPALAPPPGNPRFALFDGLRAIAALSVVVYHVGYYSRANEGEVGLSPYLARLNVGVAVFFVISGFLLYRPMLVGRLGQGPRVRLGDYARRRVLRIVPAYWVALIALAIYPGLPGVFSGRWWVYFGFAQDYSTSTATQGIGPAWSLGCEAVFYLLLPFLSLGLARLAGACRRRGVCWQAELLVLVALMAASVAWRGYSDAHGGIATSTFAGTFAWFALGMLLAVISVSRPAVTRRGLYSWGGWLAAGGAYIVICRGLGLQGGFVFLQRTTVAQDLAVYALSGVVAVGLVLPAVFEGVPGTRIDRLVKSRVLAWLGLISYGIYLYHQPIAGALGGGVTSGGNATLRFLWLLPATAAIAVAAGALSYYLVERPFLGRKESGRRVAPVSQPAPGVDPSVEPPGPELNAARPFSG
jgi:peptidoglycan/LPS O-acetylase OafA/YrhL